MGPLTPILDDHFRRPRRVGRLDGATGVGRAENAACGDVIEVFCRVEDGRLLDATFLAQGCPATIAFASFVLERAAGSRIEEVRVLEPDAQMAAAEETRSTRRHGAAMALRALIEACDDTAPNAIQSD